MTTRKPPGVSWESWTERQIREGIERGEFDDLPGKGRPIAGIDGAHDDLWWVREKLRREQISALPATLVLRKELEDALVGIDSARSEAVVRQIVNDINERIRYVNRYGASGPPSTLMPLDVEATVARWRSQHPGAGE
jgi:hypothetical protein